MTYPAFKKIPRLEKLHWSITEKIDGTNGLVYIVDKETFNPDDVLLAQLNSCWENTAWVVCAGSRSRWLNSTSAGDNYGFCKWVAANADQLISLLGPGYHYGEWWGQGIQRGYGQLEKRFSLFTPQRYPHIPQAGSPDAGGCIVSTCPLLFYGTRPGSLSDTVDIAEANLRLNGSWAAAGYANPEGLVVYLGGTLHKVIINDGPKEASRDGA